jgi:hypothetical protein
LVVGRLGNSEPLNYDYCGKLQIDDNVAFSVSSNNQVASGVVINVTSPASVLIINGTFDVSSSSLSCGCYFLGYTRSSVETFNGKFNILGTTSYGINYNAPIVTENSNQTFNGTYNVVSSSSDAYGVRFLFANIDTGIGSTQTCNGTFNITSSSTAYGLSFNNPVPKRSTQIINGTFVVSCITANSVAYGASFTGGIAAESTQIINGVFTISAIVPSYGVFYGGTINGNATINGTFTIYSANYYCRGV